MNMRRYLFTLPIALVLMQGAPSRAGEDLTFIEDQTRLCNEIKEILIKHYICQNENDCRKRQIVFCSPGRQGIGIQVWGIHEYQILEEVLHASSTAFANRRGEMNLWLDVYRSTKEQSLAKPFWVTEPKLFEMSLEKDR